MIWLAVFGVHLCNAQELPYQLYENQSDYSYMWWTKSIKTHNQTFAIKTSRYKLLFDYRNLKIKDLSISDEAQAAEVVLHENNSSAFPATKQWDFNFGAGSGEEIIWCKNTSGSDDDCQLIETGKYFQRRFITNLPDLDFCDKRNSGLEIASWPDRLTFLLKITTSRNMNSLKLSTDLTLPDIYSLCFQEQGVVAFRNQTDNSGFVIRKSLDAGGLSVSGNSVKVFLDIPSGAKEGEEFNSGLIIYPGEDITEDFISGIIDETELPVEISATQHSPLAVPLEVKYDVDKGWHQILLRNDIGNEKKPIDFPGEKSYIKDENSNYRMERVFFTARNPSSYDRILRLSFAKGRIFAGTDNVFGVPGVSAILRDMEGNPTGIPLQLSKNWHGGSNSGVFTHYFRGPWYHGLAFVTIPANSSVDLEYTSVNSMWGLVPAASHAQLCLVGWGHNQQWDESAIGAWGETITYEPDLDQTGAPVLDFRPLLVNSPGGVNWKWTGNLGGADFFDKTDKDGVRAWHSRIRTSYKKIGPNITEVKYAGVLDDNSMDFEYTASIGRSEDITRGLYKIRLDVLEDTEFEDFSIIEMASSRYHHVKSKDLAWGNETGLVKKWQATTGGKPEYVTQNQALHGKYFWFSFTASEYTSPQEKKFKLADRGLIIRNWRARINGDENVMPWFAEYNTDSGNYGDKSSIIKILPPEGCSSFKKGDYIEALVELIIIPSRADDYYGPNKNLYSALEKYSGTWNMVYREAGGNDIGLNVFTGKQISNYPIVIGTDNDRAHFELTGGLGYVPITFKGVSAYSNPMLFIKEGKKWKQIRQEVYGNDFWQSDYNAEDKTWDISFNINLDSTEGQRETKEFRFERSWSP